MSSTITAPHTDVLAEGVYVADPAHSTVGFTVRHMGIATVRGHFTDFSGTLVSEDGHLRLEAEIQAASVSTSEDARDEHLRSDDFFAAGEHPTITFNSSESEAVSEDALDITGELTIRGVSRPLTLRAVIEGSDTDPWGNDRVGLTLTGNISREDYGMRFNQVLGSGNKLVSDRVKLEIEVSAVRS